MYADEESITSMIKFTDDDADETLLMTCMSNADAWINARLRAAGLNPAKVVVNNCVPSPLVTAASYYAVSDLLQSLYGSDDRSGNEKAYFDKAELILSSFISEMVDKFAKTDLEAKAPYGVSKSPSVYTLGLRR